MEAATSEELELFRKQWQQEVQARSAGSPSRGAPRARTSLATKAVNGKTTTAPSPFPSPHSIRYEHDEESSGRAFHDLDKPDDSVRLVAHSAQSPTKHEPSSALEHYETAVQKESDGNLGDSLKHYRTAYKLDDAVDKAYKNKYFPTGATASKSANPNPSGAPVTVPNTVHHSLHGGTHLTISKLIESFHKSRITAPEPATETSTPYCQISTLPSEILVEIINHLALADPGLLACLSQVCQQLAYLTATEDNTWHSICENEHHGFRAMRYAWCVSIRGDPLPISIAELDAQMAELAVASVRQPLILSPQYPSFRAMYHRRPRIRFNGCYISTVNYIRPGAATASQATWSSPVLIVTYYRYLRFYRDGSCISLLTTTDPADVVHQLTKDNLHTNHANGLPSAVMNQALRGRWKLKGDPFESSKPPGEEGTVDIETEGADADRPNPKYLYKMMLQMKNVSKAANATKNNKLAWLGYWSYNKLTDDWAEFSLKNDRAFVWSRVRSYGSDD